ncbi:hypothetical protein [Nocardiopsis lucentensis]|uniref:hypothetical protein n=1 Tax=Nocardiopsis lucentensis TaxID=53441 RepID=UPI00034D9ABF|nr:hypothetical protein [Nocardiopsis lucentensis]
MSTTRVTARPRPRLHRRLPPVIGLLMLSPVCAEYLIGYDSNVGRPLVLLGGLLVLAPLYGAVALLIRETARRTGRGWPTILLLALAFGIVQAGLVDQSLFNPDYRNIDYWDDMRDPTLIEGIGVSADMGLTFLLGHTVWSFTAPIALVEALAPRELARRPWLGWFGTSVVALLYLAAAYLVFDDHLATEGFVASPGQIGGAATATALLVLVALALPRRRADGTAASPCGAPAPWLVGGLTLLVALGTSWFLPPTWPGIAAELGALAGLGALIWAWSRREGWSGRHVVLVAGAPLVLNGLTSFAVQPLGEPVAPLLKYGSNAFFALLVIGLIAWGYARGARDPHRSGAGRVLMDGAAPQASVEGGGG